MSLRESGVFGATTEAISSRDEGVLPLLGLATTDN